MVNRFLSIKKENGMKKVMLKVGGVLVCAIALMGQVRCMQERPIETDKMSMQSRGRVPMIFEGKEVSSSLYPRASAPSMEEAYAGSQRLRPLGQQSLSARVGEYAWAPFQAVGNVAGYGLAGVAGVIGAGSEGIAGVYGQMKRHYFPDAALLLEAAVALPVIEKVIN